LQSLCDVKTDEGVRERLGQLPPKLEELYRKLYEKLTEASAEADREVTINIFSWLLCAQRRLASSELLAALSTRQRFHQLTIEHVLEMCSNMVVSDSTLDTFRFAHLSVREFLEKRLEYDSTVTNSLAAERCLVEVLSVVDGPVIGGSVPEGGQPSLGSARSYDLGLYANHYWATHCQLAAHRRTSGELKDLFLSFLDNESDPRSAVAIWNSSIRGRLGPNIQRNTYRRLDNTRTTRGIVLFIACCFDFPEIVKRHIILQTDILNHNGLSALEVALSHGSHDTLAIFVNDKVLPIGEIVVKAAAEKTKSGKDVIQLLLEQRGEDVVVTEEVVKAAAGNKDSGKEVMQLLLEQRGEDVVVTEEVVKQQLGMSIMGRR
jgi:hypothetical protein